MLALKTERQSAQMSEIKNGGLDQYGAKRFKQQQIETAGIQEVNCSSTSMSECVGFNIPLDT